MSAPTDRSAPRDPGAPNDGGSPIDGSAPRDPGAPVVVLTARDPLTAGDGGHAIRAAAELAAAGHPAALVLLEDAVTVARDGHRDAGALAAALEAGVEVLVEDEARARRAVEPTAGVKPTTFGEIVDRLVVASRAVWL
jgi:hypothetical protein